MTLKSTVFALSLPASILLAGCASGDRVTLLTHSDGGPVGEVAVLSVEEGAADLAVLNSANQQARLRESGARLRQLEADDVDPDYRELIASLPASISALPLTDFPTGEFSLSEAQKTAIREHFAQLDSRPGYQIEIRGYTDSMGGEDINAQVSQGRADAVAAIVRELGFTVEEGDALGLGEGPAIRAAREAAMLEGREISGDEVADGSFRRVDVVIR